MGHYTIKNLRRDVDDQAAKFGLAPQLEARFARVPLECENLGISYERLAPNFRTPFGHKHNQQEEVYVVVSGSARVKIEDEIHELEQWDAIRVAKDAMRNFEAGPDGVEIIVVGAP